ncbi:hypothetical protein ASE37_09965 [Rhizobium sp. Root268]|nr:hypothetical protein ASC86_09970 [Rhizobium sp. Root1212]KRD25646.1 hypothetical protein ASE37_09965 [Rhizobium sp. Root268]
MLFSREAFLDIRHDAETDDDAQQLHCLVGATVALRSGREFDAVCLRLRSGLGLLFGVLGQLLEMAVPRQHYR